MNIGAVAEDEFQDWYDTEHLPERQHVPGFVNCERWIGAGRPGPRSRTTASRRSAVMKSPAYRAIGAGTVAVVQARHGRRSSG